MLNKTSISYIEPKFSKLCHTLFINGIINKSSFYNFLNPFCKSHQLNIFTCMGMQEMIIKGLMGSHKIFVEYHSHTLSLFSLRILLLVTFKLLIKLYVST